MLVCPGCRANAYTNQAEPIAIVSKINIEYGVFQESGRLGVTNRYWLHRQEFQHAALRLLTLTHSLENSWGD